MKNLELARIFNEIADMLEIKGESPFRIQAYRRGARAMEALSEDIEEIFRRGELRNIPGVGESLAEKIAEYLKTGRMTYFEELRASLPPGVVTLMQVPEVGPKTALLLYEKLGITTIEELEKACKEGKVRTLPRMGAKTEENILKGIELLRRTKERLPLGVVLPHAQEIVDILGRLKQVHEISLAGSIRRMKETIGDIDILVTSDEPDVVMDTFTTLPRVSRVLSKGTTRSSVVLDVGIQADVRVVEPESFGAALQYFTGSKEHNIRLRERAVRKGLKINEYGVFLVKNEKRIAGRTEEEVYASLGLPWIPPEIREDQGEIDLAEKGKLPTLIQLSDVKGDLHIHTKWSDGADSVEEIAKAAKDRGYEYICITDHSQSLKFAGGVPIDELREHARIVRRLSDKLGIAILIGSEVDILPDGSLDYPDEVLKELDVVVASVHSRFRMSEEEMTKRIIKAMENPHVDILGHPTGRLLGQRDAYQVNIEEIIEAARRTQTVLEINATPERLDLKDTHARMAKEHGVKLAINTDAHSRHQLRYMAFGVGTARRGWIEPKDVVNTLPLNDLLDFLHNR
ncbi:MAG: DNA polymerase/3'-5' exonuclease PolX [Armatimonadota bacterium]|nr:DNA polymerase/3'-5' exonuclease PolX [Armatimonadota bacterium]MDR5702700.1 DNA polymerase/3'-5' exonuclease PolX [Armatimonadota bacterium]MDR7433809.1 DNA polymerase/3'-5' exonuclease PolX [Armatimonadota bacterium]